MNAVILVAGVARRLAPLTDTTHKALLPVGGRPVLARMLDALNSVGVRQVTLVVGHCADQIRRQAGERVGRMAVRYIHKRPVASSGFDPVPRAPPQTEMRLTFSGALPWHSQLGYRLTTAYAFSATGAYATGPLGGPTAENPTQELEPVAQFRVMVGVSYDLLP